MNHETMHLFAGAGGGLLSDLILGNRPIVAVEWDKYACSILRARAADGWFPGLYVFEGDVRLFDPSEYAGRVDCIHAGFPCQDISVAGKQVGVGEGTRSGLYREVLRIADVVRPRELFLENVSAILSNGLGTVLGDLSARGYSARWVCIRASDVGANHQRDRWWLLARRSDVPSHAEHDRDGRWQQQQEGDGEEAKLGDPEHTGQPAPKVTGSPVQGSNDCTTRAEQASEFARPGEQYADVANTNTGNAECGQGKRPRICSKETSQRTDHHFSRPGEKPKHVADPTGQSPDGHAIGAAPEHAMLGICGEYVPDPKRDRLQGQRERDIAGQAGLCGGTGGDEEQGVFRKTYGAGRHEGKECGVPGGENAQSCGSGSSPRREIEPDLGVLASKLPFKSLPGWWDIEPDIGRTTDVSKDRANQLRALGNAQVPLQAAVAYTLLSRLFDEA